MSVYITAPYSKRDDAVALMRFLEENQIQVTASWLWNVDDTSDVSARKCLADICAADTLVAFNPIEWVMYGTGGRHFELGYAHARGKRLILFGEQTNLFHHLSGITIVSTKSATAFENLVKVIKS